MSDKTITERLQALSLAKGDIPFAITKIGHVVFDCRDLEAIGEVLHRNSGFKISDIYEPEMVPGGMVFMRFSADHHGVGLVGAMPAHAREHRAASSGVRGGEAR